MTEFSNNSSFYNQHNLPEKEVNSQNDKEVFKNTSINKKPLLIPSSKLSLNNSKTKVSCSLKTSKIISKAKSSTNSLSKIYRSKNSKKTLSSTAANSVTISKNNSINKRSFSNLIKPNKPTSSKSSKKVVFVKESHPSIEHEDKNGIVNSQISESSPFHIKRKLSRKDSYKHSIMIAEKKLKWKEEEKGNIQLFNDNEHQISKKRNVLGDFKDIDEENKSQGKISRKQSKKSISRKQSYKSFSSKKPNLNHNNEEENMLNSSLDLLNEMLSKSNNVDECNKKLFNIEHSHKQENKDNNEIEIEHNNIGLSEKERIVKMNEKFYAIYNEIKNKAKTAREKNRNERKAKLSKSQSLQHLAKSISSRNSKLSVKTNCDSKTLLYKILFQSDDEENNSTSNREQIKRSARLQKKFKFLKKTRSLNCFNKLLNKPENHFSYSLSARQLYRLKSTQNLDNDSFLNENNKNKEESKYKTFEELKTKTLSPKFILSNLSITKRIHFTPFKQNQNNQVNLNNTTKAKCRKYKEVNSFLKHSENTKYDNCINKVNVFPPNAIDKNKFNYFVFSQ